MPVLHPRLDHQGLLRAGSARDSSTSTGVRGGTTLAMATPSMRGRVDARGREEVAHQDPVLVRGLLAPRGEPPVGAEQRPLVDAQGRCWCCRRRW